MVRSDAEVVSQIPRYVAKRSKDFPGWLIVTCPYEDCGDIFLVRASRWRRPIKRTTVRDGRQFTITGRSCPYCFRVALVAARAQ